MIVTPLTENDNAVRTLIISFHRYRKFSRRPTQAPSSTSEFEKKKKSSTNYNKENKRRQFSRVEAIFGNAGNSILLYVKIYKLNNDHQIVPRDFFH